MEHVCEKLYKTGMENFKSLYPNRTMSKGMKTVIKKVIKNNLMKKGEVATAVYVNSPDFWEEVGVREETMEEKLKGLLEKISECYDQMECYPDESGLKAFYMEVGNILMEYDDTKTETETKSKRICGKRFSICLSGLFAVLTGFDDEEEYVPTEYGYIQKETAGENEWYDFKTEADVSCMSEEICEVLDATLDYVLLQEVNTKVPFKLSHNEFNIAAVRSAK